jgi:hypothetical protein
MRSAKHARWCSSIPRAGFKRDLFRNLPDAALRGEHHPDTVYVPEASFAKILTGTQSSALAAPPFSMPSKSHTRHDEDLTMTSGGSLSHRRGQNRADHISAGRPHGGAVLPEIAGPRDEGTVVGAR